MSTTITTRQTAGTGATVKGAPLTNAEVDANFINLNTAVLPVGGIAGQVLSKVNGTDFNTQWVDNYATQVKLQVKNSTGVTINKGSVVYISGATGANALISLAKADSDATSATTIGILESTLTTGSSGFVVTTGTITGVDTSLATEGDPVWLSGTTAGAVMYGIANKPQAPIHIVYLGTVTRSSATVGEIQVMVNNGWEMEELHDVQIISKANNDIIQYNSASGVWKNVPPATARTNLGLAIGTNVQAWGADLDAIEALAGTSGFLKKTAANTWSLDTNTYLTTAVTSATGTTNQITVSASTGAVTFSLPATINVNTSGNAATATSATSATTATNIAGGAANRIPYNSAAGTTVFAAAPTVDSTVLSWTSAGGFAWTTVGGATISDDTTTAATYYPTFATATSGTFSTAKVSSTKLTFNPSTGTLATTRLTATSNTSGVSTGITAVNGDMTAYRSGGTTGVIYLSSSGSNYLYWDATNYNLNGGNLVVTGNITANSDETLKTNWRPVADDFVEQLAKIKHGVYDRLDMDATQAGVSAQAFKTLLPEVVGKDEHGKLTMTYGNAALVSAIQLAKRLVALEATVAKLVD